VLIRQSYHVIDEFCFEHFVCGVVLVRRVPVW